MEFLKNLFSKGKQGMDFMSVLPQIMEVIGPFMSGDINSKIGAVMGFITPEKMQGALGALDGFFNGIESKCGEGWEMHMDLHRNNGAMSFRIYFTHPEWPAEAQEYYRGNLADLVPEDLRPLISTLVLMIFAQPAEESTEELPQIAAPENNTENEIPN